jgi:serine phosphatase RsbU (regulator of sigma subunit)
MYVERRKAVTVNFDEIARHYGEMTEKGIIMSFKGALAQPIIVEIGQTLRSKIAARPAESTSARARLIKTIFSIFIELAQNVMHYSAEKEEDENGKEYGVGLLVISQNAGVYAVSSANQIPVDAAERVRDKCESIAAMTREKLKERYNEQRRLPPQRRRIQRSGLGLARRRAAERLPLEYQIVPLTETRALFVVSAKTRAENFTATVSHNE